jgi:hypothetical protein
MRIWKPVNGHKVMPEVKLMIGDASCDVDQCIADMAQDGWDFDKILLDKSNMLNMYFKRPAR